jgi:hypothetical protein
MKYRLAGALLCSVVFFASQTQAQSYRIDLGIQGGDGSYKAPWVTIVCPSGSLNGPSTAVVPCVFPSTVTAIPQVVTPSNGFANSQVTTGGTAVTAVTANGAPRGGTIYGPSSCSLCLDATTTAGTVTGTPQTTFCLATGQIWNVQSSTKPLSVNSATSACPINGYLN